MSDPNSPAAPERAPDCTTTRAAATAGIIASAVMAGELDLLSGVMPDSVASRLPPAAPDLDFRTAHTELVEGFRVAGLMISARARASVRTPRHAAISGAEAALALAEDALDPNVAEGDELPDAHAVLASIRDALRAGLAPLHAAEGQAPYDAGPPAA